MASLLPPAEVTFTDANGVPLAGGSVTFYIPNTTTPKDTWQNSGQSILNSNPITLDSAGRAIIYGSGTYRQVVKDAVGNLIWDQITSEPGAGPISYGGTSTGTANAQILSSGTFSSVDGSILSFIAGLTNTGSMTMSVGGSAPIPVLKNGSTGPVNLDPGDIAAGNVYSIQYNAANASFQLLQSIAPSLLVGNSIAGFLFGLTLSNDATDAVNDIDIAVGSAASDATPYALMTLGGALVKRLDANWAVGTNQGGLDTGSIANITYHVWLIQRSDTGVVDVLFSASATTPTMPTFYNRKRRIGSIIREAAAIVLFYQKGDLFRRTAPGGPDYNSTAARAAALLTVAVPTGIVVRPILSSTLAVSTSSGAQVLFGSAIVGNIENQWQSLITQGADVSFVQGIYLTNTSAQLYLSVTISSGTIAVCQISAVGWFDDRGRNT